MDVGKAAAAGLGDHVARRLIPPTVALVVVVALGTLGYHAIGGGRWTLLDCAYMTVITLTTVGYREALPGFDEVPYAREFTMAYLVFGMGVFLYFASSVTALIIEGDLKRAVQRRRMNKRIRAMKNHYVVCGCGSTGRHVMEELMVAGKQAVVIDRDAERLAEIAAQHQEGAFDYVVGDATEDEVLERANIAEAAGVVAALADDKDNLYLTVAVRSVNPNARIVARGSDLGVLDKLRRAGAHAVVSPNYIGGMRMVSELVRPHVVRFLDEMLRDTNRNVRIEEVPVPPGSPVIGMRLGEARFRSELDVGVVAVLNAVGDEYTYNPGADFEIGERMTLVVLGPMSGIRALRERVAPPG
ncbi:MAG: potassium channel protein [Deltaproteobacteria bacterium]|nr:MAG: potassium channel protein [Deltaproteobacteria bacterium]